MKQITAVLIGAGNRGRTYTDYARRNPDKLKIIGVAEPVAALRENFAKQHNIPSENIFYSWEDVFAREKFADVAMICTQDRMHFEPAMAAIENGYDILLEKPISPVPEECITLADTAENKGVKVVVCHVLRYTRFFSELKGIIDSGEIGEVVSIVHNENVGAWHHAHSFTRGNWRNKEESGPMILTKSCHDTDIIQWLIGKKCLRLSSFGSLKYFNRNNCPEGAPAYCLDGCPHSSECPYDARKKYLEKGSLWTREIITKSINPSDELVEAVLRAGPYGRCVFQCDNNVVDHQTVNMEFEDGVTALFSMSSFTPTVSRTIKIMGTKGQIDGHMEKNSIKVTSFLTLEEKEVKIENTGGREGHGGGDMGMMKAFCEYIGGSYSGNEISEIRISAENHMLSFAAEESRINGGRVIEISRYK